MTGLPSGREPVEAQSCPEADTADGRRGLNPRMRSHLESVAKAVSWRVTAGIDTFVISYLVTGSVKGAGSIALMELFTKIGLFWAHERAWLRIGRLNLSRFLPGRTRPSSGVE
ncbi:DUF2061 domain-containing protein [Indioceanicola profundi]|uniref:DUF2061 domain-containing protein n=1 Tax=Indioceanicola profundi TaxID=2220096 RepID=UPI0019692D24|nr:DUF2061 domain-containing protein [Indioceanicola profundi]